MAGNSLDNYLQQKDKETDDNKNIDHRGSKISFRRSTGMGGGGVHDGQLPTFDAESKSAKIPNLLGKGGVHDGQLPTFDTESKSAKIPNLLGGGGGGPMMANFRLQTFLESKSAQIPKSIRGRRGGGGGGVYDSQVC